jgi:hypothetical protein
MIAFACDAKLSRLQRAWFETSCAALMLRPPLCRIATLRRSTTYATYSSVASARAAPYAPISRLAMLVRHDALH